MGRIVKEKLKVLFVLASILFELCLVLVLRYVCVCVLFNDLYMGLVARNPVFGVSDKAGFKPVSSATEIARKIKFCMEQALPTMLSR